MFEVEDTREDTCNGYHSSDLMNSNRQRIDSFLGQISTVQFYCKEEVIVDIKIMFPPSNKAALPQPTAH